MDAQKVPWMPSISGIYLLAKGGRCPFAPVAPLPYFLSGIPEDHSYFNVLLPLQLLYLSS